MSVDTGARTRFVLPPDAAATVPPEARGLRRDEVRLLVAGPDGVRHRRFADLPHQLRPGDLLVVNTSATLPSAVDGVREGGPVVVHFSTPLDDGGWLVELRPRGRATGPLGDVRVGQSVLLPGRGRLVVRAPHGPGRLWRADVQLEGRVEDWLHRVGRPIAYAYVDRRWSLEYYQTVFAQHPGSAEMPSAGRPFTNELVTRLASAGVLLAPVLLHAGVSSLEPGEPPLAERFTVPAATADLVRHVRGAGGRVVGVGTTAVRALESAVDDAGDVRAAAGWTDLVLGDDRPARVVDGVVTGWHEPGTSHLALLEAVAGAELVGTAYGAAVAGGYLWHEFGDSCLLLAR